ncbi:GNAT family N-acetyltransferase [Enterococcus caccae]|uniref:N-acetyltransferase domain-containing protein n=1 Tax=Enterococcus caccae ATCC BAA-1240 TaxID=1158612 RepID=R3WJR4_9ENTE|nr:N-acetyltransferase [Enterococcus caccae]EOL47692.1 hypothetical protein UC7_00942 [Enterococcus caccae ATCC BAA-1240]EOT65490.1 hypothetical protein I580_01246 [Enterococcus caccae ATCC BAA-1240]OJG27329.1 hypothetical protein RU98_GL002781 [Enterococcus caccae]
MMSRIEVVHRGQLNQQDERAVFHLLLVSFSTKFARLQLTAQEKLDILVYLGQKYSHQTSSVDYIAKEGNTIVGLLTVLRKAENTKKFCYPFELSKKYGFFPIFHYVLLLTALGYQPRDKERYIENIAVDKQYQKQGIAKELIKVAQENIERGEKLSLLVSAENTHALRLYLTCGFSIVQRKRTFLLGFLANEPNWIVMEWSR